jgi:hypothetical protein
VGKFVKNRSLYLANDGGLSDQHQGYDDGNRNRMFMGYLLDHNFQALPLLTNLKITAATLYHCDPDRMDTSQYLQTLYLRNCDIYPRILPDLSMRLPQLTTLHFQYCCFRTLENASSVFDNNGVIDMPHNTFKCISYSHTYLPIYDKMVRKIVFISR